MYSQGQEQEFILRHTPETGRFLDLGAFNAKDKSNTRALYEKGWSGVMVEPSPIPMHGLLQEYGNDERITLVSAAVGLDRQPAHMHITQDALSTTSPRVHAQWTENGNPGGYYGRFLIPQILIEDITNWFSGDFQFVSIDTEGSSVEILKAMLKHGLRPPCICYEHDGLWRIPETAQHYEPLGYVVVHCNEENSILVRMSK